MTRINLDVPFAEKDEARALGAEWDYQQKVWFVPEGMMASRFWRWLPRPTEYALDHGPSVQKLEDALMVLIKMTEDGFRKLENRISELEEQLATVQRLLL